MRRFRLDPDHPIPVTLQLRAQITHQVRLGLIRPGDQLPSVRALATRLNLNRNTVARVMAEIEAAGFVSAQQGRGVFAADDLPIQERAAELRWVIGQALESAGRIGLSTEEFALALFAHSQMVEPGPLPQRRVLIVGGERLGLRTARRAVEAALPVVAEPVFSDALPDRWGEALRARDCPPVLVTPAYLAEVEQSVAGSAPVIPLVRPQEQQRWEELWRQPNGTPVTVAAADWVHAARLHTALSVASPGLQLRPVAGTRPQDFVAAVAGAAFVVCAGGATGAVREVLSATPGPRLLLDTTTLDEEQIRTIRHALDAPRPAGQRDPHGVSPWF